MWLHISRVWLGPQGCEDSACVWCVVWANPQGCEDIEKLLNGRLEWYVVGARSPIWCKGVGGRVGSLESEIPNPYYTINMAAMVLHYLEIIMTIGQELFIGFVLCGIAAVVVCLLMGDE